MLRPAPHIRYHIVAILAAYWIEFVAQYKRWIPDRLGIVFENVHKVLACSPPARHLPAIGFALRLCPKDGRRGGGQVAGSAEAGGKE